MQFYARLLLILSCFLNLTLVAAEPEPAESDKLPAVLSPANPDIKREPVFPIEDLIGKPTPETDRFLSEFLSMLATLGLIIALILFIAWFLKRMVNAKIEEANLTSSIKIIDKRNLSPKTIIYMIEVNGKGVLVAESQNGVASLGSYPADEDEDGNDEEPEQRMPKPFKDLLAKPRNTQ